MVTMKKDNHFKKVELLRSILNPFYEQKTPKKELYSLDGFSLVGVLSKNVEAGNVTGLTFSLARSAVVSIML